MDQVCERSVKIYKKLMYFSIEFISLGLVGGVAEWSKLGWGGSTLKLSAYCNVKFILLISEKVWELTLFYQIYDLLEVPTPEGISDLSQLLGTELRGFTG